MPKAHALIIDDDAQNIEVLGTLLRMNDVTYVALQDTGNLQAVLSAQAQVDLVFLDIVMPKMNGYEILAALKAVRPELRIVACTVHSNEMSTARQAGFDGFVAKPIDPKNFSRQLSRILSGKPVWDAM